MLLKLDHETGQAKVDDPKGIEAVMKTLEERPLS